MSTALPLENIAVQWGMPFVMLQANDASQRACEAHFVVQVWQDTYPTVGPQHYALEVLRLNYFLSWIHLGQGTNQAWVGRR